MADGVPLENSDVRDKDRLGAYRYFRSRWLEMLNGDDRHAIYKQITQSENASTVRSG